MVDTTFKMGREGKRGGLGKNEYIFIETLILENRLYNASYLLLSLLNLVCVTFDPAILTHFCDF